MWVLALTCRRIVCRLSGPWVIGGSCHGGRCHAWTRRVSGGCHRGHHAGGVFAEGEDRLPQSRLCPPAMSAVRSQRRSVWPTAAYVARRGGSRRGASAGHAPELLGPRMFPVPAAFYGRQVGLGAAGEP